jgi:hypothetical protein
MKNLSRYSQCPSKIQSGCFQNASVECFAAPTCLVDVYMNSVLFLQQQYSWSWDSVVGIVTSYGLDDQGVGVRVPVG